MDKILSKDIRIENNHVIIKKNIETTMDRQQIVHQLRSIDIQKKRLREQNGKLIDEYNKLLTEEGELEDLIEQLSSDEEMEVIEDE